jgi:sarcosine oxidase subunit alpha
VRACSVVLASGAHERGIAYANNDLPGTMLAGAVRTYVGRYAVRPGRRRLHQQRQRVRDSACAQGAGIESRQSSTRVRVHRSTARRSLREAGLPIFAKSAIVGARGTLHVAAVDVVPLAGGSAARFDCDLVALSGGWNPAVHLHSQARGKLHYDETLATFVPDGSPASTLPAGAAANKSVTTIEGLGSPGAPHPLQQAFLAEQAAQCGYCTSGMIVRAAALLAGTPRPTEAQVREALDANLCRCGTYPRIIRAVLRAAQATSRWSISSATRRSAWAPTRARYPTSLARAAGETTRRPIGRSARRRSARRPSRSAHSWHRRGRTRADALHGDARLARGARRVINAGLETAAPYPGAANAGRRGGARGAQRPRQRRRRRRIHAGRSSCRDGRRGIPNRVYINRWDTLAVGRCRYGVMLRDDGIVFDDGTVSRLAPAHYLMTTTTVNAVRVLQHLEMLLQVDWPDLEVFVTSVTEQWAAAAVSGPAARFVLAKIRRHRCIECRVSVSRRRRMPDGERRGSDTRPAVSHELLGRACL